MNIQINGWLNSRKFQPINFMILQPNYNIVTYRINNSNQANWSLINKILLMDPIASN